MILWLDHKIFGNGYGLGSPYFDQRFYWLSGGMYTWSGWFGSQLQSFQWRHPKPGEERRIAGRRFKPFHSTRHFWWLWRDKWWAIPTPISRVRVAWCTDLPEAIDHANEQLRELQKTLGDHIAP